MMKTRTTVMILGSLSLFACAQSPQEQSAVETQASALTYKVGSGQTYSSFSALPVLKPGDVVEVNGDATYGAIVLSAAGTDAAKITIRGIRVNGKRPVISGGTNTVDFEASHHVVFEGFDVTGGTSRCIFNHANDVTIRDTVVHDCPAHGILGADYDSGSITLDHVEVHHCGYGDQKHPIYIATDEVAYPGSVFRMQYSYLHDNNGGHGVKSRAERNEIYYNWIEGSYYHELELIGPDGPPESLKREDSDVVGNVIRKAGSHPSGHTVRIGGDGTGMTYGRYRFVNNTFLLAASSGSAIRVFDAAESIEAHNNVFYREGGGSIELIRTVEASPLPAVYGTHNWIQGGSAIPAGWTGSISGTAPGFASMAGLDLHPASGSAILDQGQANPVTFPSHPFTNPLGIPGFESAPNAISTITRRAGSDAIDIGAFEGPGTGGTTTTTTMQPMTALPPPPPPPPPPPTTTTVTSPTACSTTAAGIKTSAMTPMTGHFTATFTATPGAAYMSGGVMLGSLAMTGWSDGAAIVVFDGSGIMKVRNGDGYAADTSVVYAVGTAYRIRMDVDVPTHRYSVYVTPAGGTEVRIASAYAFRTAWNTVTTLGNWAAIASSGSVQTCGFAVN
jgi:hypothetical protein